MSERFDQPAWTGPYVLHCHILGHEDRGMMQNLQTTCPNGSYGTPANYGPDFSLKTNPVRQPECSQAKDNPAGPLCAPTAPLRLPSTPAISCP